MIHVVGLGLGHLDTLHKDALDAINNAAAIIGSQRQLSCVQSLLCDNQQQINYPRPFAQLSTWLSSYLVNNPQHSLCLLASGDPLFYGVSDYLLRHFPMKILCFYSNTSAIQTAFARIKKPWQQAKIISLHGRPLTTLIPYLANHPLIALFTDQHSHPQAIATQLCQYGYDKAILWVCETLGTNDEKVTRFKANELAIAASCFHPLHITIIETKTTPCRLPSFPGFEDTLFITDSTISGKGMISKREVRLVALSLLQPQTHHIAWDIGAGCGTIAVEWAYWNQQGSIYAVEHHPKRLRCLAQNKHKFGVSNLHIIKNKAPNGLADLPQPHAIFIGGTAGELNPIMDRCWQKLIIDGCMVINCVTESCKTDLLQWLTKQKIENNALEWSDVAISKGDLLAGKLLMRPRLPVRLLKIVKQ